MAHLLYAPGQYAAEVLVRWPVESTVLLAAVMVWQVVYVARSLWRVSRQK